MTRATAIALLPIFTVALAAGGCYSFRGGSVAPHLHTVTIPQAEDISPQPYQAARELTTTALIQKFRDDNTLRVVDATNPDSRLEVTLVSINTQVRRNISGSELESVRGVEIVARSTFFDNVKKRAIYKDKAFTGVGQFNLSEGPAGEKRAVQDAINNLTSQILNDTVADW
ncbi:MAG: hypothetical protein ABIR47_02855 [Candidatus Kapaibacterium sp.]